MRPRWRKVLSDLWGNKTRTILVVLSIAVGVFAVGMLTATREKLSEGLAADYAASNPASAMLMVSDPFLGSGTGTGFGDDLVNVVRRMRGVGEAEGRRKITVRLRVGPNEWRDMQLFVIPDYEDIRINKIYPERGAWPPDDQEMLVERAAMGMTQAEIGDVLTVKTPNGKLREIRLSGVVHDMSQIPAFMDGRIYGYITLETLEWLGVPREYNELYITVANNKNDLEHIQNVAEEVKEKVERSGRPVYYVQIPVPGKAPMDDFMQAIILMLGVLGGLSLILSAFLVVTTISAILAQHTKQIGILKSIGARRGQIMQMYFVLVLAFGVLALLIAIPLGMVGSQSFASLIAGMFNFDLSSEMRFPIGAIVLQVIISLTVPVLAALLPIINGTRITVREALFDQDGAGGRQGEGLIDRLIRMIRGLSRPLLLSLRNTVRRKGRLALTLTTLTLSGTMFISVFNIRDSLFQTLDDLINLWQYDLWITLSDTHRIEELEAEAMRVPGVVEARGIGFATTRRNRPDNTDSDMLMIFAVPPDSNLIKPVITDGRWLKPEDENAIVVSTEFLKIEDDLAVGDEMILDIDGEDTTWQLVGVCQFIAPFAFVNYPHFSRVKGEVGRANTLWLITRHHTMGAQTQVASVLEQYFEERGLSVSSITKIAEEKVEVELMFNVIVVLLAVMAVLLAFVGGLGLMGTMSINVLERTREIGIMRAIGASNRTVMQMVMTEGILIGLVSWMLSVVAGFFLSKPMSDGVGMALFRVPLAYGFSVSGLFYWLAVVVVLSALASFLPAWNASRLTVHSVLAYE